MLYRAEILAVISTVVDASSEAEAESMARDSVATSLALFSAAASDVIVKRFTDEDMRQSENLRLWQEWSAVQRGTDSQRARWGAGVLPDVELLGLARDVLFEAFSGLARRERHKPSDIAHPRARGAWVCASSASELPVTWTDITTPHLSPEEWDRLTIIGRAVADTMLHPWLVDGPRDAITVTTRETTGTCSACQRSVSSRSAMVQIKWAGRTMSREFSL